MRKSVNSKPLVVVESPTKVKTIKKYLGKDYNVAATVGHIKDLPVKELGIDIDDGFKPQYRLIPGKQKVTTALKKAAGDTNEVYLASDPDREGEAIAFHASEVLKKKGRIFHRVLFHELTRNAILESIQKPEELNQNKYEAQKARRILDRLVGYKISPLLWRKVQGGLSAGRVQSVAVRIICERERQIQAFEPEEYWSVTARLKGDNPPPFEAKLTKRDKQKIKIRNGAEATALVETLKETPFLVESVSNKTKKRNPLPPFITSKLQQESIRKLRFSAKKTMMLAQQLYEGIELEGGEPVGLITYMRTDSTRIANEAAEEALTFIRETYGAEYSMGKPRFFKNRKKAQDAHEAIRPTSVSHTPDRIKAFLTRDQYLLYRLIWNRFVASQMKPALIDTLSIGIRAGAYLFTTAGSNIVFPGFMAVYISVDDEIKTETEKKKGQLPTLSEGMVLHLEQLNPKQHFTMPPPRFSEASLVKELEENGIGRPSTYAAILSTIRVKKYVDLVNGYFKPSELGMIVNDLLVGSFDDIFNVTFTARMETYLDQIEASESVLEDILERFYSHFNQEIEAAKEGMPSLKGVGFSTDLTCPQCQNELRIKMGRNGHFLACNGYPKCTYSRDYTRDEKGNIQPVEPEKDEISDRVCEKCAKPMVIKPGRFGKFFACSGYPECKNTYSVNAIVSGKETGVDCPEKDCDGKLVEKQSKRGKVFYGCSKYPDCNFATWDKPLNKSCPVCNAVFLVEKSTKKKGSFLACLTEGCGYTEQL